MNINVHQSFAFDVIKVYDFSAANKIKILIEIIEDL